MSVEHTFGTKPNKHGASQKTTVEVPSTPEEWAKAGWDVQATMLSAATVKVQNEMRANWTDWNLGNEKARVERVTALFRNGGVDPDKAIVRRVIQLPASERKNKALIASMESQGFVVEFVA